MAENETTKELELDFRHKPGETDDQYWDRLTQAMFGKTEMYQQMQVEKAKAETKH
jgi:hypothetical protein